MERLAEVDTRRVRQDRHADARTAAADQRRATSTRPRWRWPPRSPPIPAIRCRMAIARLRHGQADPTLRPHRGNPGPRHRSDARTARSTGSAAPTGRWTALQRSQQPGAAGTVLARDGKLVAASVSRTSCAAMRAATVASLKASGLDVEMLSGDSAGGSGGVAGAARHRPLRTPSCCRATRSRGSPRWRPRRARC